MFWSVCATLIWAKVTQDKPQRHRQTTNKQGTHRNRHIHNKAYAHTHWGQSHTQTDAQTLTQREKNTHPLNLSMFALGAAQTKPQHH